MPILPIQSILYLTFAKYNVLGSNYNNSNRNKKGLEDKGRKPSKKQKTK
jgi:hypothetical protein